MATDDESETRQTTREALFRSSDEKAYPCLIVLTGPQVGETHRVSEGEMVVGREANADIQLLDDTISRRHALIRLDGDGVAVEDLNSRNGVRVNGQRIQKTTLSESDKVQFGESTVLRFTYQDSLDESFQRLMFESALRDGLTGAFNKRYFVDRLDNEVRFAQRHLSPLSLLMIDLDHFKAINDAYGHVAGDVVLNGVARTVQETIRVEDVLARFGGEEFAVIGRGVAPQSARILAERIRARTKGLSFNDDGREIRVTLSIGVAGLPDLVVTAAETLIRSADAALYAAKTNGRNRVEIATAAPVDDAAKRPRPDLHTRPYRITLTENSIGQALRVGDAAVPSAPNAPRVTLPPSPPGRKK